MPRGGTWRRLQGWRKKDLLLSVCLLSSWAPPSGTSSCGRGRSLPEPQVVDLPARVRRTSYTVSLVRRPHQLSCSPLQGAVSALLKSFWCFPLCSFCFPALGMVASRSCYLILQIPITPSQQFFLISSLFMLQVSASWLDSHCYNSHLYFTETLIVTI